MSGHSKWSTIKHKKGKEDAKRGKIFSKLTKEITVAARLGGGNPNLNSRLRVAIQAAKAENMPKETIEKAIKKGTGELPGVSYEEVVYEGYGSGGVAVLVETLTDNKNRATADIRHIFSKNNGTLGEAGCVSWMFEKKGMIVLPKDEVDEDKLMEVALECEVLDVNDVADDNVFEVYVNPSDLERVKKAFEENNLKYVLAEVSMIPQGYVKLEGKGAEQMLRLMEELEDSEEVQRVYANFDIPKKLMEELI